MPIKNTRPKTGINANAANKSASSGAENKSSPRRPVSSGNIVRNPRTPGISSGKNPNINKSSHVNSSIPTRVNRPNRSNTQIKSSAGSKSVVRTHREREKIPVKYSYTEEIDPDIERIKISPDRLMLVLVMIILCLGLTMVYSASYPTAIMEGRSATYYILRQAAFAAIGLVCMFIAQSFPYKFYKIAAPAVYLVSLVMLVAVLFVGFGAGGVKRQLGIPNTPFAIQPSEAMKPGLVFMLAWYIEKYRDKIKNYANKKECIIYGVLIPMALIGVPSALVLLGKHLSGAMIIAMIGCAVVFIGGCHPVYNMIAYPLIAGVGGGAYLALNPYALKRITTFASGAEADILNEEWQTAQGLNAIGSGGFLGLGLGNSRLKYSFVSEPHNDFIFTIWCEEMGFVGAIALICLFIALIMRGYLIASKAPTLFTSLLVYGMITKIAIQVLLNLMVVTDSFPNTGISLPFFSYGGTSLFIQLLEMGVILSISRHSYQRK